MKGPRRRTAAGFSLLEILVATSMLAMAMAALSQLASISRGHLDAATQKSTAARLAANQLARLATGIDPLVEQSISPMEEDPSWESTVKLAPIEAAPGLVEVEVGVRPATPGQAANEDLGGKRWFYVTQWVAESEQVE